MTLHLHLIGGDRMIKLYGYLEKIMKFLLITSLAVMAILNFANVLSRYFLHASISFTEELTTNLFVYNTFIGAALGARKGSHLGVSLITDRVSPKIARFMMFAMNIISAGLFGVLVYLGYGMVKSQQKFGQTTAALGLQEWWFGLAIPVGAFLIMIAFIVAGFEALKRKEEM